MKSVVSCLRTFGSGDRGSAARFSPLLAALRLEDFGLYVSGEAVEKRRNHRHFDIQDQVFALGASLAHFNASSGPLAGSVASDRISCSTLYEDADSTLCWFVVPPGHTLPLHDHPCMHVWQRVMYGELHITAFDWVESAKDGASVVAPTPPADAVSAARERSRNGGVATIVFNGPVAGSPTPVIADTVTCFDPAGGGGVLHEISNRHPTMPALFVDIIAPPYYTPPDQWPCTYYTPVDIGGHTQGIHTLAEKTVTKLVPRLHFAGPPMEPYLYVPVRD